MRVGDRMIISWSQGAFALGRLGIGLVDKI